MATKTEVERLALALAPFLAEMIGHKRSMIEIQLDPAKALGIPARTEGAGQLLLAIATGPSIPVLTDALAAARTSQPAG